MLAKVLMCPCFSESFQEKGNSYQKKKKKKKNLYLLYCKCKDDHDFLVHACNYHPFIGKSTKLNY